MNEFNYSTPEQDARGMWTCEVTDNQGFTVLIARYTTKKSLMNWLKSDKKTRNQKNICPRCQQHELHPEAAMNALSRKDNKTLICANCGTLEALQDLESYLRKEGGNQNG